MSNPNPHASADSAQPWARSGRQPRIAIIGAGMSGIAAVVKLEKAGYTDVTVYEKSDRVGGTWRENTYPGLSCDVPSRWYSFSFALKPDWKHRYPYGEDIQSYMETVATDFGVTDKVIFNSAVTEIMYNAPHWHLSCATGAQEIFDVVISATGLLHHPAYPAIEGLENFSGAAFHSARWDHTAQLKGKRVGVIGTGSTACQIIGAITPEVDEMHVFQRTTPLGRSATAGEVLRKLEPIAGSTTFYAAHDLQLLSLDDGAHVQCCHHWQQIHEGSD